MVIWRVQSKSSDFSFSDIEHLSLMTLKLQTTISQKGVDYGNDVTLVHL